MSVPPVSPEQQARVLQVRQAALLKRYVAGQRLGRGELRELKGILPDSVIKGAPIVRASYQHPLEHYETIYGRKVRMIKLWIATGRDAVPMELPPLDEPPKMKAWWIRQMKHRVPLDIEQLAAGTPKPPPSPVVTPPPADTSAGPLFEAAAAAPGSTPAPAASAPPLAFSGGFAGALQRLRAAEAAAGELYTSLLRQAAGCRAEQADDRARLTAEAEGARRAWDELVDKLRSYEKDASKILAESGKVWSQDEVVASQEVIHLALKEGINGLLRRVRPKLKACVTPAEEDKLWQTEVDKLFGALRANRFSALPVETAA